MEKIRLYVWIALAAVVFMGYTLWQQDYPPPQPVAEIQAPIATSNTLPALPGEPPRPPAATEVPSAVAATTTPTTPAPTIHVRTDVLDLSISTQGGELDRADMIKYPLSKDHPEKFVRLFDTDPDSYFVARSGLRAADEHLAPTHLAMYTTTASEYHLDAGQDTLAVSLTWTNNQGITVVKTYTFKRGSYIIGLDYKVDNQSATNWSAASYIQLARHQPVVKSSFLQADRFAFNGPSVFDGKREQNLKLDKEESKDFHGTFTGGWLAAMQNHFVAAAIPQPDQAYDYRLTVESPHQFNFLYRGPIVTVAPGATKDLHETLFVGPKLQVQLEKVGSSLERTADYGMLTIIAQPLFWLLNKVHSLLGNWGWSIILTTLLIKLAFYKLTEASGKSMAKMREAAPRIKALQERYKDDREQLGRATMEFYKREKINPVAGCLPMLIQMPVFMAFYWVILNSAEMKQAPFIGYLTDLSSRDPYFILPVLYCIAQVIQFKLNPAPPDPVQAKVMMMMPILMTGMMIMFPSGLVLYWIVNTSLSILQQWHINRVVSGVTKKA